MFCFILSLCVRNKLHLNQFIRCVESLKNHHKDNKIIIINGSIDEFLPNIYEFIKNYENIDLVKSLEKGSEDQQVFKIILDQSDEITHYFILQDSMILCEKMVDIELIKDVKFLWHFTNHIHHWDTILEPECEYNTKNNIITHTDLIRFILKRDYFNNKSFLDYSLEKLNNKHEWCGCFGNCCIITKECVKNLNNKTGFADIFIKSTSNRDRRANESIFALLCHYYYNKNNYTESYDGLYYDGIHTPENNGTKIGEDNLIYWCKKKYIGKISFVR